MILHLSQLSLNVQSPEARRDLLNPYELHRTLLSVFDTTRQEAGVLYRVEGGHDGPRALVQSVSRGEWSRLPEDYLRHDREPESVETHCWRPAFACGQVLRFRLRASPCFKRGRQRLAWLGPPEQLAWLERQAQASGCEVRQAEVASEGLVRLPLRGRQRSVITHGAALFDGLMSVNDPALLAAAIRGGLGRAKAFGCGLLSVAPV